MKNNWFEGSNKIGCTIQELKSSMEDQGKFYTDVVSHMPGLTNVELLEQGSDFVTIKTNEGYMKRTNISKQIKDDSVIVEFDEEYQAGSMITASSHFCDTFLTSDNGVSQKIVISEVTAPGFAGFFYRKFGSSNIGNAVMKSYQKYFEKKEVI